MKTFTEWKIDKVEEEGYRRPDRYWYYEEYGKYVAKYRQENENVL